MRHTNTLTSDQTQWHAGWDAYDRGESRDPSKGYHWLEGWDAHHEGEGL